VGRHGDARIQAVHVARVRRVLADGCVPIVAGFQGVSAGREVTTLGRGGSDTTAVALAIALRADRCDVYTDVDGIYSADPRVVATARRHAHLTHRDALRFTLAGADVLHPRAAALALTRDLPLRILSSLGMEIDHDPADGGTRIDGGSSVHAPRLLGIAAASDDARLGDPVARVTIVGAGVSVFAARIADAVQQLAHAGLEVETVGVTKLGFVVHVTPARADDAVRLLHDALLGAEHQSSRGPNTRRSTTHATPAVATGRGSAACHA
jgi:aspartokinase